MLKQIRKQWFLIGLLSALMLGYLAQQPLASIAEATWLRSSIVACVLYLMGLAFSMQSLFRSIRSPKAALLATGLNVFAIPATAASVAWMLPLPLGGGLIVASAVPCTLASASLWTRRAGGDDAVSMMVTVVTNLLCFVIAPTTLVVLLGKSIQLDFMQQVTKLGLLVVAPLSIAQIMRRWTVVACFATAHKQAISIASQCGILAMVTLGTVVTSRRIAGSETSMLLSDVILMIVLAASMHLVILFAGWFLAGSLGLARPQRIAVAIAGSQKTLMVGLQIAIDCGVSMMPMIAYHICQLVLDTIFEDRWASNRDDAG